MTLGVAATLGLPIRGTGTDFAQTDIEVRIPEKRAQQLAMLAIADNDGCHVAQR